MRLESGYTPRPYFGTGVGSLTADPQLQGITKSFGGGEVKGKSSNFERFDYWDGIQWKH